MVDEVHDLDDWYAEKFVVGARARMSYEVKILRHAVEADGREQMCVIIKSKEPVVAPLQGPPRPEGGMAFRKGDKDV
jgi:hypothetical protein